MTVSCLTLCFAFVQFTDAMFWTGATFASGPDTAGAGGLLNTGGNLPGILTGTIVPALISRFGWTVALASGAAFALIAALLWLAIDVEAPSPPASHRPARPA